MQVRVLMVAVFNVEDGQEVDRVVQRFQEEAEAAQLCHAVERARVSDLDDFQPSEVVEGPDLYVSHLDCEE